MSSLKTNGWVIVRTRLAQAELEEIRASLFSIHGAGQRCLLDHPLVSRTVIALRSELTEDNFLPAGAVAIQAIAFDKTPVSNWKVTWHQDVMFPFACRTTTPGYDLVSIKDGVDYARPPRTVLDEMLAVRLHLDDCDATNGPLRVATGSHRDGVIKSTDLSATVERHGDLPCLAQAGEAILIKPLLLHASSLATTPRHRRVLHLVFHSGKPISEKWHRAV